MNLIPDAISVVIPTYNRAHLIKESIQSVLDQTLRPYEIIVVDDFSTDNTEEVVNSFNSPLIKYVKNQRKKGANGARNTGILIAKGQYIAFQDSDDIFLREKLQKQSETLNKMPSVALCFCSMKKENAKILSKKIVPKNKIKTSDIERTLKLYNYISTQTIFIRTEVAKKNLFNEDLLRFQDWDFVLRLSKEYKFYHFNEVLVVQRLNESSITNTSNYLIAYEKIYNIHPSLKGFGLTNKLIISKINYEKRKSFIAFIRILFLTIMSKSISLLKR